MDFCVRSGWDWAEIRVWEVLSSTWGGVAKCWKILQNAPKWTEIHRGRSGMSKMLEMLQNEGKSLVGGLVWLGMGIWWLVVGIVGTYRDVGRV